MLQERFSHPGVNWFDGMSINKSHFVAQENHMQEMCIDAMGQNLNPFNYGILSSNHGEPYKIQLDIENRKKLKVKIRNLRAITLGGARIEITTATSMILERSWNLPDLKLDRDSDRIFALIITINPYSRKPFGDADPEETPPRKPHVLPEHNLDLIPFDELGGVEMGLFHITLGVLTFNDGQFTILPDYIPPCTSIASSPMWMDFYEKTRTSLIQLENDVTKIVQKVRTKQQENNLAQSISSISENILTYLSHQLPSISLYSQYKAPVFLIEKIIVLAKITHNSIETWQGSGKEELLNYLTEWCDLNQGMLDKTLSELGLLKYQHQNAAIAVLKANNFMKIIIPLFKILSELDYIGKKIDTNLFVTEEISGGDSEDKKTLMKGWFRK